jgi:hypothetical protein
MAIAELGVFLPVRQVISRRIFGAVPEIEEKSAIAQGEACDQQQDAADFPYKAAARGDPEDCSLLQ